jgi:Flp pilus assembly protein TadD
MASATHANCNWARSFISNRFVDWQPHSQKKCGFLLLNLILVGAQMRRASLSIWIAITLLSGMAAAATPAEKIFAQASAALNAADYDAAESGFRQVLKLEPNNLGALGNLGVVYSRTHRYAKAIEVYNGALKLSPRDPGLLLDLGLVYLKQDDYVQARPLFRRFHNLQPHDSKATNLLATCLVFGGQPAAAIDLLKPALTKASDPASVYLLGIAYSKTGQVEAGKRMFDQMLTNAATAADASFLLGHAYYDSDKFEEAESAYKDVLRADPGFAGVHRELGKAYISLRRNGEAQKELQLALQQDPEDRSAVYFLAGVY